MKTTSNAPLSSRRPNISTKTKLQQRSILTPRLPTDIHRHSEKVSNNKMVNSQENNTVVSRRLFLESATRRYHPPESEVSHFLWSKNEITNQQKETMNESVDIFLDELKETSKSNDYPEVLPRILKANELPYSLTNEKIRRGSPRTPKKILDSFEDEGYWSLHQKPLTATLPELYITKQFQNYVFDHQMPMPEVLRQAPVAPPPDPLSTRRPKRPRALFVDKSKENQSS